MAAVMTNKQVMKRLKMERHALARARKAGRIPFIQLGPRTFRYPKDAIERLAHECAVPVRDWKCAQANDD
jgi:hypothetical protein